MANKYVSPSKLSVFKDKMMSLLGKKLDCSDLLVITEDMVTVTTDATKGVAPYNTSYGYTTITINDVDESIIKEGSFIFPIVVTKMVVASAYRNVRIQFGASGRLIPVLSATSAIAGNSFFTKSQYRLYYYSTKYVSTGAFHLMSDSNTTYTPQSLGFGYGTCSTAESTIAKVVTLASYSLVTNGIVAVKFTNAVCASATMNINSRGAKAILYRGSAITDGVIKAGDIATFIYNGTNYILLATDSKSEGGASEESSYDTTFNSDGSISTAYADGKSETTEFLSDGSIVTKSYKNGVLAKTETTVFNDDGSISVTIS